jgi:hypothetical protein
MGKICEEFGNEEEALKYYLTGFREKSSFYSALEQIIQILVKGEEPEDVKMALANMCESCTGEAYFIVGRILFVERAYSLAGEYLAAAITAGVNKAEANICLAICLGQQDRFGEAFRRLSALVYAAITGSDPPAAADRLTQDRLQPLALIAAGLYSERFLAAIDATLAVQPRRRPADHAEFRALMGAIDAPEAVSLAPRPDLMQEPFAGAREVTVPDRPSAATAPAAPTPAAAEAADSGNGYAATRPPPVEAADADTDHAPPTWMQTTARGLDKRALYGVIAGTCALIGIAALVLQFATKPAPRGAPPAAASATRAVAAPMKAAPAPTTAAPVATPTATRLAPGAQAHATASAPTPAPAVATATAPKPSVAGTSAPARPTAAAHVSPQATAPPARAVAATSATPRATPASTAVVVSSPAERQARCTEILQKASLEKITPDETDFFKRECK